MLTGGPGNWPGRTLFFQWHRGDAPDKFRAFAARAPRYKLVQAAGVQPNMKWDPKFELFDIQDDPFETKDLAAEKPEVVAELKREYEAWFVDVTKKGFDPPRIVVGSEKENPVRLTRQDMRGPKAGWAPEAEGHWVVKIDRAGEYEVTIRGRSPFDLYTGRVDYDALGDGVESQLGFGGGVMPAGKVKSRTVTLEAGNAKIRATVRAAGQAGAADYIELKYLGPTEKK